MVGNRVSHANNKTKTRSLPNLQKHRFWLASKKKWVTLRVSTHALRIINVKGIEAVYAKLERNGEV